MLVIRRAEKEDLPRIMEIYGYAREFMSRTGNPNQWGHSFPPEELIREDIRQGVSYLICEEDRIHGVFALLIGIDPTYVKIYQGSWLNDDPYVTIHRIAGDGEVHGILACAVDFAGKQEKNIRIDTHEDNKVMQRQIEKQGFVRCGIIFLEDGSPRIAYHLVR